MLSIASLNCCAASGSALFGSLKSRFSRDSARASHSSRSSAGGSISWSWSSASCSWSPVGSSMSDMRSLRLSKSLQKSSADWEPDPPPPLPPDPDPVLDESSSPQAAASASRGTSAAMASTRPPLVDRDLLIVVSDAVVDRLRLSHPRGYPVPRGSAVGVVVVLVGHDQVPAVEAVLAAVGDDVARLPVALGRRVGDQVRPAAAVDAGDDGIDVHGVTPPPGSAGRRRSAPRPRRSPRTR